MEWSDTERLVMASHMAAKNWKKHPPGPERNEWEALMYLLMADPVFLEANRELYKEEIAYLEKEKEGEGSHEV